MIKNYEIIMFDLDGTLTDPKEGITKSFQYALKHFGINEELDNLVKVIGPPLKNSFIEFYGFSDDDADAAVDKFREYFKDKGIYENEIFVGIKELLSTLKDNNKTLLVATSKPTVFANTVLKYFDIDTYFDHVVGSNLDGTRVDKGEVIDHVLSLCDNVNIEKTIMIGDRKHDIIGANKHNVDSIGVLYGYGSTAEFEDNNATYIVKEVKDLEAILLSTEKATV